MTILISDAYAEELECEFESAWHFDCCGIRGIQQFLASRDILGPLPSFFASSLAQIDIERSWLGWSRWVEANADLQSPYQVISRKEQLPSINAYEDLFSDPKQYREELPTLVQTEANAREMWGDAIGALYYENHYGTVPSSIQNFKPRSVSFRRKIGDTIQSIKIPIRGTVEFGRQRSRDADDLTFESTLEGLRVIVTDRRDATISRQHVLVRLLTYDFAIVENISKVNEVLVSGTKPLSIGSCETLRLPFTLNLPSCTLFMA